MTDIRTALAELVALASFREPSGDPRWDAAWDAARAALAEQPMCACKDRAAADCPGEWGPGCDLGANEKFVRVAEQPNSGQVYGIIDPDYGRIYTMVRKLAWEEGYAIGLHGSFTRDLDLIAVPWTGAACEPEHLVRRIVDATGLHDMHGNPGSKPMGRLCWTLTLPAFNDPRFVDLSIMPIPAEQPSVQDDDTGDVLATLASPRRGDRASDPQEGGSMSTKWHSGPPPSIGWWPASVLKDDNTYRWWNGRWWSVFTRATCSADEAEFLASKCHEERMPIFWRHRPASWPARSKT